MRPRTHADAARLAGLALLAAAFGGDLLLNPLDPDPAKGPLRYALLVPLSMGVLFLASAAWANARALPRASRGAVRLLAVGLAGWGLGNWAWLGYNLQQVDVPYPSWADAGYLVLIVAAIAGMARLFLHHRRRLEGIDIALAAGVPLTVGSVFYNVLLRDRVGTAPDLLTEVLNLTYPMADMVYVALAVLTIYFTAAEGLGRSLRRVAGGLLLMAVADVAFISTVDLDVYFSGTWVDMVYIAALAVLGNAAARFRVEAEPPGRATSHATLRVKVMMAVVLALVYVDTIAYSVARDAFADDPAAAARFVLGATVAFAVTGAFILFIVSRSLEPLDRITAAARRLGRGEEDLGLRVPTNDEMQVLAEALVDSARALAEARRREEAHHRALVQTEKLAAVGSLTAGVAHEVNNPLAYILTNEEMASQDLDAIARDEAVPAAARELAREARADLQNNLEGLRHIQAVVMSLRMLSRASSAEREAVDLAGAARSVLVIAADRAQKEGVALEGEVPEGLVATAAKEEVGQVLLNLVLNGIDAAGRGGRVVLQGEAGADEVVFRVADTGPGIPPAVQARLFNPFFTTKANGVGLGLSLSHKIVKEHGGTLSYETWPGRGTEFLVRLPRAAPRTRPDGVRPLV